MRPAGRAAGKRVWVREWVESCRAVPHSLLLGRQPHSFLLGLLSTLHSPTHSATDLSPPGSVLVAHNITFELLQLIQQDPSAAAAYAPFPPDLVATWRSGHALASDRPALAAALEAVGGWQLVEATSRARIAAQVCTRACGGEGIDIGSSGDSGTSSSGGATVPVEQVAAQVDFEARPDEGRDRWAVFFVANK